MRLIRTALASAVIALGCAGAAYADASHFSGGDYDVRGTNPDGSKYKGTAEITVTSDSTCRIVWHIGEDESEGICMRNGIALAAAYYLNKDIGLVIYEIRDDDTLDGIWTIADQDGSGTELLIPQ
ncbi:MAG TPA: hypothetical protein VG894_02275 [Bauldia sp.]|nr:hypothetical protein [Bauldia sp.]